MAVVNEEVALSRRSLLPFDGTKMTTRARDQSMVLVSSLTCRRTQDIAVMKEEVASSHRLLPPFDGAAVPMRARDQSMVLVSGRRAEALSRETPLGQRHQQPLYQPELSLPPGLPAARVAATRGFDLRVGVTGVRAPSPDIHQQGVHLLLKP